MNIELKCGFVPLVDAAPLIVAREIGFAAQEGLDLTLVRQPSWSAIRDKLSVGAIEAAQLLSPLPIATAMGLGGLPTHLDVLQVLSVNGDVVGVSRNLAERMRGHGADIHDARAVGRALIASADRPIRVGVPFPFSMHAELLYYWLDTLGLSSPQGLDIHTVPPPMLASALAAGEVDAFCVGEPWGSIAVERGVAEIIMSGDAIWKFAPEKVLAVRHDWATEQPDLTARLMRAIWRAGRWLSTSSERLLAAELMARSEYLDLPTEIIERAMRGRLIVSKGGQEAHMPRFLEFFDGAATFPWRSQAVWIANRIARRAGLDRREAARAARSCFRADLYRENLGPIGADLPGASEKLEGALTQRVAVSSSTGEMFLGPDSFFDGTIFDPSA